MERILNDMMAENTELKHLLSRNEAELTRAEESLRRKQQQIQEMVNNVMFLDIVIPLSLYTLRRKRLSGESGS